MLIPCNFHQSILLVLQATSAVSFVRDVYEAKCVWLSCCEGPRPFGTMLCLIQSTGIWWGPQFACAAPFRVRERSFRVLCWGLGGRYYGTCMFSNTFGFSAVECYRCQITGIRCQRSCPSDSVNWESSKHLEIGTGTLNTFVWTGTSLPCRENALVWKEVVVLTPIARETPLFRCYDVIKMLHHERVTSFLHLFVRNGKNVRLFRIYAGVEYCSTMLGNDVWWSSRRNCCNPPQLASAAGAWASVVLVISSRRWTHFLAQLLSDAVHGENINGVRTSYILSGLIQAEQTWSRRSGCDE